MRLKAKVGPKGQAVIPKEVRDILGIAPGDEVIFEVGDKEAKIKPAGRTSSVSELTEIVPKKDKLSKDVDVKKLILSETIER
ncbi:MAG: AbrB/MazE/SpoVT family DNA-binding domain-containing protein [Thaumarchaeota archaeon]|nr:AbrB/MazE/SpoVT family DNA-binding domain-containing protein [Nitrososphaerota archaeon]MBI3116474.1 AbrB/MazE/SpoVT family DNA-binding domain-containing protein [Nitrososphaerota archaeon]